MRTPRQIAAAHEHFANIKEGDTFTLSFLSISASIKNNKASSEQCFQLSCLRSFGEVYDELCHIILPIISAFTNQTLVVTEVLDFNDKRIFEIEEALANGKPLKNDEWADIAAIIFTATAAKPSSHPTERPPVQYHYK